MKSCSCTFVVFTRPGRLSLMDLCKLQNIFCFPSPAEFHLVDRLKSILKAYYYFYALAFSWDVCRIVFVTKTKHWRNFSWKRRYKKIKKILQKCNQPILCEKCKMLLMDRMTILYTYCTMGTVSSRKGKVFRFDRGVLFFFHSKVQVDFWHQLRKRQTFL